MKLTDRFEPFSVKNDSFSRTLDDIRFDLAYFTHFSVKDGQKLTNLVSSHIKLVFQVSGQSIIRADGKSFDLCGGGIAVIPPYRLFSGEAVRDVTTFEIFFNIMPVTREQEFLSLLGIGEPVVFPDVLGDDSFRRLGDSYEAVHTSAPGSRKLLESRLISFLLTFPEQRTSAATPIATPREQDIVSRMLAYIDRHMSENVSVDALAPELGVSSSFLYRSCIKVMGCSAVQVISRAKLKHASLLLRDPNLSVGEVAAAIGYDPFYFSARFKKQFLISPSDYRKTLI